MTTTDDDAAKYESAVSKLAHRVRSIHQSNWSPTTARKECEAVADALEKVARLLTTTPQSAFIEDRHNRRGEPGTIAGPDGWPEKEPAPYWPSYKSIQSLMRSLAQSARQEATALPDPRENIALQHAAMGMLYLRHWHGFKYASGYIDGETVSELERIATLAGMTLSRAAFHKALNEAMKVFDQRMTPPEFRYLFRT